MMNRQNAWIWPFAAVLIFSSFLVPVRSWAQQNDNWNQGNQNQNNSNDVQNGDDQNDSQNNNSQNNDTWDADNQSPDNDPPSRVAYMNFTQGSVSFQPGGEGDWVDAVPNRPLTTGDNLWTDKDSRAELHVGSTSIRMGSEASLTFLQLDDRVLQLRLAQGSTLVRVRHFDDDDTVEIDTPNLAFMVQRTGEYRVDVQPDGQTTIIAVYQGRGEAIGGGNNYTIVGNQQASFSGDPDQGGLSYDINSLPSPDWFTRWAFDRDRHEDQSQSANYVSPEMTGYEDLDDNGSWSYAGNYGPVWYPRNVPAGWAPYRYGHWAWIAPWGWTWVDDASWGFAPFHYGRWALIGAGWAWIPGPAAVRPVYAPALVAFVGGGGGFHFSASFGGGAGVAWFPLGPGEVFVPAYHVSRAYVNQVNVTNTVVNVTRVTNVYNTYNTRNVTNVNVTNVNRITYMNQVNVTAVSRETFVNARPIAHNVVAVQARDIAAVPVGRMTGVEPIRGSVMGSGRPTTVAPPRAVIARQVVAQHVPVQPPTPFAQRQDKLAVRPANPAMQPGVRPMPGARPGQPVQPSGQALGQPMRPSGQPNSQPNYPNSRPVAQPGGQPTGQPQMGRPEPVQNRPEQTVAPVERPIPQSPRPVQTQPEQQTRPQPGMRAPEQNNNWNNGNENRNDTRNDNRNNNVAARPQPGSDPTPNQGWSHPQAKPAPPVQPKSENQARDEENKYRNWQQQAKPAQAPPAKPAPPPAKDKDKK